MAGSAEWVRYADFCRTSPYAIFPQEHRQSGGSLAFHMMTVDQNGHDFADPSVPETVIALPLSVSPGSVWGWNMGDGWHKEDAEPGRLLALPESTESRWRVKGNRKLLLLAIPRHTVQRILGPDSAGDVEDTFRPLSRRTWCDPLVEAMMQRMWSGMTGNLRYEQTLLNGALCTTVAHLVQRVGGTPEHEKAVALPAWRVKRIRDHVDAHLQDDLDVVTLAEMAGLSVRHFSRAFTKQVGQTPHRWIMSCRVERALQLLRDESRSLVDIASECGFSSQSHLSRVLKQETGHTPKRWRSQDCRDN
jgi:AraC family transcriptional regulator